MEFVWRNKCGASCLCLREWEAEGLCHGFFTKELDADTEVEAEGSRRIPLFLLKQVHGVELYPFPEGESIERKPMNSRKGDGWLGRTSDSREWIVGVKTADCIPVLLWHPQLRLASVLHCGRKGTVDGLLDKTLAEVHKLGASVWQCQIAIGPGVSGVRYEIGRDLAEQLAVDAEASEVIFMQCLQEREGSYYLDLKEMLRLQALRRGVEPSNIAVSDICTIASDAFHSYRRDREAAGRQLSIIGSDGAAAALR